MNEKKEIEELNVWGDKIEKELSDMISAANNYLDQFEKIPKVYEKLALLEDTLCTALLTIQEIKNYGDT